MNAKLVKYIRQAGLLVLLTWGGAALAAEPVAMVTDVEGKAVLAEGVERHGLSILSELKPDARVQLENGARMSVVYLVTGQEYELEGPALIRFKPNQPEALSGARPRKAGMALAKGGNSVRIKPVAVAQAAIVMRDSAPRSRLKLLSLTGTRTLDARPVFQWQPPQPGLHYQFELLDDTGKTIFAVVTDGATMELPAQLELKAAVDYSWVVSTVLPDGAKYSNVGDFSVAPAGLRVQAEKLRPGEKATVSERVLYASWLEQMELRDEARKYWKSVAAERQGHERLKELMGDEEKEW